MEDKRNLDDLIKSSFDKINKGAPNDLWGKLSSALDADAESPQSPEEDLSNTPLDIKVKESFSSLNRKVPKQVWTAINRQLNIERTWEGISNELDKTKPLLKPKTWIAAAVLLLLLLSTGIYVLIRKDVVNPGMAERLEKNIRKDDESFIAFEPEEGKEKKEQKARTLNQPVTPEKESSRSKPGETANSILDKKYQNVGSEEEGYNSLRKRELKGPKEIGNSVETKKPSSFFNKQDDSLPLLPASIAETSETKKLIGKNGSAGQPVVDLNKRRRIVQAAKGTVALEPSIVTNRTQLIMDEILFSKVKGLPLIPEENTMFIKVETVQLDTLAVQKIALEQPHDKKEDKLLNVPNFEAGPVWVYHNSWLLNNETRNSFDENSLISTNPTYKQNWGLALNYNLTGKSSLSTEIHFFNKAGQQYKLFGEGKYLEKGLELQYHKVYIQYQRNFTERGKGTPAWFTVKAGVYGGVLQEKIGEIRQEESRYTNFDYGFRVAFGQEYKLGRLVLGYGLSTERGLKNVFGGTEKLPATFNKTFIQSFGTYLNVRYAF